MTYDAKDPETSFPPIEPLSPPAGAPNVLVILLDDVGFGASSAFGGPCNTPTADRLAAGGLKFNRFHTTALCAPTRQALLTGRNHHSVNMGSITETATSAPGPGLGPAEEQGTPGDHAQAQRLLDRTVRQVPRGAGLADLSDGPVRRVADRWRGLRALLRLHRRGEQPVRPRALQRDHADRAAGDGRGGLPPHRGPDRPRGELDAPAEGADARQAVLRLLRARRDARPAPGAERVDRALRGQVRRRLGRAARADLRPPEGAGRHPARTPS